MCVGRLQDQIVTWVLTIHLYVCVHGGRNEWGRESRTNDGEDMHHPDIHHVSDQTGMAISLLSESLFSHLDLLMDVDVLQKLQEAISRRGQTILDYCATLDNPKIRDVLACYDPDSDKAACILLLLMLYFGEFDT